jgi:hypothetical protein
MYSMNHSLTQFDGFRETQRPSSSVELTTVPPPRVDPATWRSRSADPL